MLRMLLLIRNVSRAGRRAGSGGSYGVGGEAKEFISEVI